MFKRFNLCSVNVLGVFRINLFKKILIKTINTSNTLGNPLIFGMVEVDDVAVLMFVVVVAVAVAVTTFNF